MWMENPKMILSYNTKVTQLMAYNNILCAYKPGISNPPLQRRNTKKTVCRFVIRVLYTVYQGVEEGAVLLILCSDLVLCISKFCLLYALFCAYLETEFSTQKGANKGSEQLKRWKCCIATKKTIEIVFFFPVLMRYAWGKTVECSIVLCSNNRGMIKRKWKWALYHFIWMPLNSRQKENKKICLNATPTKMEKPSNSHSSYQREKNCTERTWSVTILLTPCQRKTMEIHDVDKFEHLRAGVRACVYFTVDQKTKVRNENGK